MSIRAALRAASLRLEPVSESPRLDAELLLGQALDRPRTALLAAGPEPLGATEAAAFESLLRRRLAGEPLAYIRGQAWFHGLPLAVGPAVLIPRPETEGLVEWALAWIAATERPLRVLDLGTGSGAIALALAAQLPAERLPRIEASDISAPALALARANARRLGLGDRVRFRRSDLLPQRPRHYDLVLANLPYVGEDERDTLPPEVRDHEPPEALFAGPDGLALLHRLCADLPERLAPGGALGLEIGWRQGPAVLSLARRAWPSARLSLRRDLAGRDRIVTVEA